MFFFQRKLSLNYNFPIFHREGRSNISRGSNPKGRGSNCIFLHKPIEFVKFSRGLGSGPLPPPLDPRLASLTGFVHTSSWPNDVA